jgi:hypothetical protein
MKAKLLATSLVMALAACSSIQPASVDGSGYTDCAAMGMCSGNGGGYKTSAPRTAPRSAPSDIAVTDFSASRGQSQDINKYDNLSYHNTNQVASQQARASVNAPAAAVSGQFGGVYMNAPIAAVASTYGYGFNPMSANYVSGTQYMINGVAVDSATYSAFGRTGVRSGYSSAASVFTPAPKKDAQCD